LKTKIKQREQQHDRFLEEMEEKRKKNEERRLLIQQRRKEERERLQRSNPAASDAALKKSSRKRHRNGELKKMVVQEIKAQRNCNPNSDDSEPEDYCSGVPMFKGSSVVASESSCDEKSEEDSYPSVAKCQTFSDDESPEEVKFLKATEELSEESKEEKSTNKIQQTDPHSQANEFQKSAECGTEPSTSVPRRQRKSFEESARYRQQKMVQRPPTLLERLLAKEMRDERTELLQCVKYVVENNFLGAK
jgi:hypothetical protein